VLTGDKHTSELILREVHTEAQALC
jgi:hypothetical protein